MVSQGACLPRVVSLYIDNNLVHVQRVAANSEQAWKLCES